MPSITLTYDNTTRDHFIAANDHANDGVQAGKPLTPKQRISLLVRDFILRQLDGKDSEVNAANLADSRAQRESEVDFS